MVQELRRVLAKVGGLKAPIIVFVIVVHLWMKNPRKVIEDVSLTGRRVTVCVCASVCAINMHRYNYLGIIIINMIVSILLL